MKKFKRILATALCALVLLACMPTEAGATTINGQIGKVGQVKNLKAGVTTIKSVNIRWTQVSGVTGYQIYRATARNGKYTLISTLTAGNQAFCNTTVKMGTEYFYKVRAYVRNGNNYSFGKFSSILRANTKQRYNRKLKTRVNANMRKYAGTGYGVKVTVPKGTKVTVYCTSQDKAGATWYRVKAKVKNNSYTGYIKANLLN